MVNKKIVIMLFLMGLFCIPLIGMQKKALEIIGMQKKALENFWLVPYVWGQKSLPQELNKPIRHFYIETSKMDSCLKDLYDHLIRVSGCWGPLNTMTEEQKKDLLLKEKGTVTGLLLLIHPQQTEALYKINSNLGLSHGAFNALESLRPEIKLYIQGMQFFVQKEVAVLMSYDRKNEARHVGERAALGSLVGFLLGVLSRVGVDMYDLCVGNDIYDRKSFYFIKGTAIGCIIAGVITAWPFIKNELRRQQGLYEQSKAPDWHSRLRNEYKTIS